jgi:hypothetical protein
MDAYTPADGWNKTPFTAGAGRATEITIAHKSIVAMHVIYPKF